MVYRKGELSKSRLDREWPHQIALIEEKCTGGNYVTIRLFCEDLSLAPRGHSFKRDQRWYQVFCFAEREHAEKFRERFSGEFIAPKDRPPG